MAQDYDVNSLAVPRRAKEAIGAITRLTYPDGRCAGMHITLSVKQHQLPCCSSYSLEARRPFNRLPAGTSP